MSGHAVSCAVSCSFLLLHAEVKRIVVAKSAENEAAKVMAKQRSNIKAANKSKFKSKPKSESKLESEFNSLSRLEVNEDDNDGSLDSQVTFMKALHLLPVEAMSRPESENADHNKKIQQNGGDSSDVSLAQELNVSSPKVVRRSVRLSHIKSSSVLHYSEEKPANDDRVVKLVLNSVQNGKVGKVGKVGKNKNVGKVGKVGKNKNKNEIKNKNKNQNKVTNEDPQSSDTRNIIRCFRCGNVNV